MKTSLFVLSVLAVCSLPLHAQPADEYGDGLLPGLQSDVVRAQLVPLQKAQFSAGISAIVSRIYVQEGAEVAVGDRLLSFDCDRLVAAKSIAQAKIDQADAKLKVNNELLKLNSVGQLEIQFNVADLEIARGELASVASQLKHCELRAPFAGAITLRSVEPWQFVAEGEPLLELVSRDQLEVRMLMPSTSLAWLSIGTKFQMLVEELNTPMTGEIARIGGAVDPVSLTIQVFGKLTEAQEKLLPGMSGRVQFVSQVFE